MCRLLDWGFIDPAATNKRTTRFLFHQTSLPSLDATVYTLPSKLVKNFTDLYYTVAARKARISADLHNLLLFWRRVHTKLLIHLGQVVKISISKRTLPFQNGWVVWRTFKRFRKGENAPNSKLLSSVYQYIKTRDGRNFPLFLKCISLLSFLLYTLEELTEKEIAQ